MGSPHITVVFDANIYISFFLGSNETIRELRHAWHDKRFVVYSSESIITEVQKVVQYPKLNKKLGHIDERLISALLQEQTKQIQAQETATFTPDPDDTIYLEAALAARADYIVTGDKQLLALKEFRGIKIVNPKEFLNQLGTNA